MPTNECMPYFEPGNRLTGHATAPVTGKRFLKVSDDIPGGMEGTENIRVAHADRGGPSLGVSAYDALLNEELPVINGPGMIVPVTAGEAIFANDEIMVGAEGKAARLSGASGLEAHLITGVIADNNSIDWEAVDRGVAGNDITIALVFSDANVADTTVAVTGTDIVVTLSSTDVGSGTITATAQDVIDAVNADSDASDLVLAENNGASDGSGLVTAVAETPLAGGADPLDEGRRVGLAVDDADTDTDCPVRLYT